MNESGRDAGEGWLWVDRRGNGQGRRVVVRGGWARTAGEGTGPGSASGQGFGAVMRSKDMRTTRRCARKDSGEMEVEV